MTYPAVMPSRVRRFTMATRMGGLSMRCRRFNAAPAFNPLP